MPIAYDLKRSHRRRSVAIRVEPDGKVTVLAPRFALGYFIDRLVQKRTDWIRQKLDYFEAYRRKNPPKEFVSGESFPIWGREYRLKVVGITKEDRPSCELVDGRLRVSIRTVDDPSAGRLVQGLLRDWYARQTEERLQDVLPKLAVLMGVAPATIKVVNQKKRWASCSRKGNLRFNWRLSMMPPSILDYVIVHELAHIRAHDHSRRFWDVVHSALPDFKNRRLWLRENGLHLGI
jgi:predicted metal-dependent hydrolase